MVKHSYIPDSAALKKAYNEHYSGPNDYWSVNDLRLAKNILKRISSAIRISHLTDQLKLKVLDVGCAKGYFTEAWRLQGFSTTGIDVSDVAISIARKSFPDNQFIETDGMRPIEETTYDLIFIRHFSGLSTHAMDHVTELLKCYYGLLQPNGFLIAGMSTDLSGEERENEMVNWDTNEIKVIEQSVPGYFGSLFAEESLIGKLRNDLHQLLFNRRVKRCYYLLFHKR